uniref:Uncharacterized protein n=1 Tax=Macrostomum lignano TaxID=282301 RepID=A0A1I8F810_9PLAT
MASSSDDSNFILGRRRSNRVP